MDLATAPLAVAGGDAFVAVFGVFVAAFVVLAVVTLRWAVRRDRAGRAEWIARRSAEEGGATPTRGRANGHSPRRDGQGQPRPGERQGEGRPQGRGHAPRQRRGPGAAG